MPKEKIQIKIGEILIKEGLITAPQLEEALVAQKNDTQRKAIGEVLVAKGFISEENLALALSKKLNLPFLSFKDGTLKISQAPEIKAAVPEMFARQNRILPYNKTAAAIHIACSDPQNILMLDDLKLMTRLESVPAVATISDILKGLDELYGKEDLYRKTIETAEAAGPAAAKTSGESVMEGVEEINIDMMRKTAEGAPLVKLVDLLIMEAISNRASDIHIEPFEHKLSIRYRIDGILYEIPPPAKHLALPLVSRIKILARMDISEKRLPQDGGFMVRMKDKAVDLRVSTMPTIYGEKVVIRILDKSAMTADLSSTGFEPDVLAKFKKALAKPNGLIFITGPTGSGKSTTLYAALNELRTPKKNIVTIEDPVEYRLEGVNQVQIKPQIGLTFAAGVRSFLRQDPDIVMVGETRDLETAEICVRASLVGRLVLSTLHTNDAASTVSRLIDLGVEPFLVSSSLIAVEAQRLVRKLCPDCKKSYEPDAQTQKKYALGKEKIYKASGCDKCRQIGYSGRVGIFEVLIITENIRQLILKKATASEIKDLAVKEGMRTLLDSGIEKVKQGITSLEEVLSIIFTE